jgi:methylthioribose-1-phosphate isomerase
MRTIDWDGEAITIIDQSALPGEYRTLRLDTVEELIDAIHRLAVRGAPALGAAGALGVALAARRHPHDPDAVRKEAERLAAARPTAANLRWGVEHGLARLARGGNAVSQAAHQVLEADERTNRHLSQRAADIITEQCDLRPLRILTMCNSGALAAVAWGTGLGAIRVLAERGAVNEVLVCETRPLLQGARLTIWELAQLGIPHRLCIDSAGPAALARDLVDCVVVGADRITRNGDVANKIGTYSLACAAALASVPFVVVAPDETVDQTMASGAEIPIEERAADEVRSIGSQPITLPQTPTFNPAFDVTPISLITAVVTPSTTFRGDAAATSSAVASPEHSRAQQTGREKIKQHRTVAHVASGERY